MTLRTLNLPGSTSISGAAYDDETRELVMTFEGGSTYRYYQVHPDTVAGLEKADSAGAYWRRHQGRHAYHQE